MQPTDGPPSGSRFKGLEEARRRYGSTLIDARTQVLVQLAGHQRLADLGS